MERKKKVILAVVIILAAAVLGAAGLWVYRYINRYDAGEYVQAVLDVSYKNDTEMYTEITGIPEKEAEKIFEKNLDATMEGFNSADMPEKIKAEYRELIGKTAKRVSYTVGKPVKEKGCYTVKVAVKPLTIFSDTYSTFQEKAKEYADQITDSVMQGSEIPSDEEMHNQIYQIYYEVLNEKLDSGLMYGEVQNVVLHVTKEGTRNFTINSEDMDQLDSLLIEQ